MLPLSKFAVLPFGSLFIDDTIQVDQSEHSGVAGKPKPSGLQGVELFQAEKAGMLSEQRAVHCFLRKVNAHFWFSPHRDPHAEMFGEGQRALDRRYCLPGAFVIFESS